MNVKKLIRSNSYNRFCILVTAFLLLFVVANYFIWENYTSVYYRYSNNDLARIGYISLDASNNMQVEATNKDFREIGEAIQSGDYLADVVTIGDSFSNGGGGVYYQNFMGKQGLKVLNIPTLPLSDEITTVSVLLNSGYLEKINPQFIIIESVERSCATKYSRDMDFNRTVSIDEINHIYSSLKPMRNPEVSFINSGNIKFLFYNFLYLFSDHAYISQVYQMKLKSYLFSAGKDSNKLLFFHQDIKNIKYSTPENITKLNNNMNQIAGKLNTKGIALCFMPVVDKYDLYYDYIEKNKYPLPTFFEQLRLKDNKEYYFIDTKRILHPLIARGVKDVYHAGDTHWSNIAAQEVVDSLSYQVSRNPMER